MNASLSEDCLFLHVPRFVQGRREIMVMPLGVPALANLVAARHGMEPAILHLGIEREANPSFSLGETLRAHPPRLLLISLHWYPQTRSVINTAKRIRGWLPDTTIVLGGLTASVFAHEILEQLPFVDGVVQGDGEGAIVELGRLVAQRRDRQNLRGVPNLLWRDSRGGLHDNGLTYRLDMEAAAELCHGSLRWLRHRETYVRQALYADFSEGAEEGGYARAAYLNAGRGCTVACVNCGGAGPSQTAICGRSGVLLYPQDKLIRDVVEALDEGARVLRMSFDPPPARKHVQHWFEAIGALGQTLRLVYDLWYPPSSELLDSMAATFQPGSTLILSPECGSESVRFRVRGLPFSNDTLMRSIHEIESRGFRAHCFFSAGLPTETPEDIDQSAALIHRIRRETRAGISVCPMVVDPGSPLFAEPEKHGATLTRRSLRDFYEEKGVPNGPGYETSQFTEAGIMQACDRLLREAGLPAAYSPQSG